MLFQLMIIVGSVELGLAHGVPGCVGRPCLSGSSTARIGDKMAMGVTQRGCGRSFLVGCPAWGRQLQGCWELAAGSSVGRARRQVLRRRAQAAGARTWSPRLRRVWWQRRASLRATDSSASWPSRRVLTCWK